MIGAFTSKSPSPLDVYDTGSKQILVPRDPVYRHAVFQDNIHVSKRPPSYLVFGLLLAVVNPLLAPLAILFSFLSMRAFKQGDLMYAEKWSQYAFLSCLIILGATTIIYTVICLAISTISYRGGHSY